jgi:hypothetical protein
MRDHRTKDRPWRAHATSGCAPSAGNVLQTTKKNVTGTQQGASERRTSNSACPSQNAVVNHGPQQQTHAGLRQQHQVLQHGDYCAGTQGGRTHSWVRGGEPSPPGRAAANAPDGFWKFEINRVVRAQVSAARETKPKTNAPLYTQHSMVYRPSRAWRAHPALPARGADTGT